MHLWCARISATLCVYLQLVIEHAVVVGGLLWMIVTDVLRVVQVASCAMRGKFHVVEAAMWVVRVVGKQFFSRETVFGEAKEWIEQWLEVCFTNECGGVAGVPQICRDARRVLWQRDTVHPNTMCTDMLAREHGAS